MDQIYTHMMTMAQNTTAPAEKPVDKGGQQEGTSFRDLLEKQHSQESEVPAEENAEVMENPQAPVEGTTEQDWNLDEQLLAAALSAMQRPVIPVQPVVEEVTVEGGPTNTVSVPVLVVEADATAKADTALPAQEILTVIPEGEPVQEKVSVLPQVQQMPEEVGQTQQQTTFKEVVQTQPVEAVVDENVNVTDGESAVFGEVKEVLVKVGETGKTESTQTATAPQLTEQIGPEISKALEQGEMRLTVQLNPENLGRVDVELTLTKDGALHVELRAENRLTQQLLEKESAALQQGLSRGTQQDVEVQVTRQQESQQQNFEDGRQGGQQRNPQQEREEQSHDAGQFLQQLRLGLVTLDSEES